MRMLNSILENSLISRLAAGLPRSPMQVNRIHESDAEILTIPGCEGTPLALTTDTVAEEIASGLYADPWLIGWMTVMVNLSDLAAVGARALGLLIAETLPPEATEGFLRELQSGIADACRACDTYVLGGDTNSGPSLSMTACALGLCEGNRTLSRLGCSPGELVFASGPLGSGSTYAYARMTGSPLPAYRPLARLREGALLRSYATCCMDTSDGLLATLDQLMRLNGAGFTLDHGWESALTPESRALARHLEVPDWVVVAGEHGEFELVFTVPLEITGELFSAATSIGWSPVPLGHVTNEREIRVSSCGQGVLSIDTAAVRNCAELARRDVRAYLEALRQLTTAQQCAT